MRIAQLALEVSLMRRWTSPVIDAAAIFLIVMAAKTAIAEPYYVPSGSMEPTLQIGDELLATKYPYGYSAASLPSFINLPDTQRVLGALPQRGDIVVFRWPGDRSEIWVKRVIGLPGDRIAMRNGRLSINGAAVALKADGIDQAEADDGSYQPIGRFIETLPGNRSHPIFKHAGIGPFDNMAEILVPPDHLFVMGDNRDNSADSRIAVDAGGVGLLPVSDLVGRVEALVGSWDLAVRRQPLWRWPAGLRLSRFFTSVQ
jgi:signal peptidase I